jgi:hypothetical protein
MEERALGALAGAGAAQHEDHSWLILFLHCSTIYIQTTMQWVGLLKISCYIQENLPFFRELLLGARALPAGGNQEG